MKNQRKILSILLSISILASLFALMPVSAQETELSYFVDDCADFSKVVDRTTDWQLENRTQDLGTIFSKTTLGERFVTYRVNGIVNEVQIDAYQLTKYASATQNYLKIYVSDDNTDWNELEVTYSTPQTVEANNDWSAVTANTNSVDGVYSYVKVVLKQYSEDIAWLIAIDNVSIGYEYIFPEVVNDPLQSFANVFERSQGIQIDASNPYIGWWVNKTRNNDVQYLTYAVNSISSVQISVPYFTNYPDLTDAVKAYWSADNETFSEIELSIDTRVQVCEGWSSAIKVAKNLTFTKGYLKVELGELVYNNGVDPVENCYGVGISGVITEKYDSETAEEYPEFISDGLENFMNVYKRSEGIQVDGSKPELGYWVNKVANNDPQYLIYRVNSIGVVQINVPYLTNYPELTDAIKAYWSSDNETWEEITLSTGKPTEVGSGWSYTFKEARKLSYGKGYLKVELGEIVFNNDIDAVAKCYAVGVSAVVTTPYDPDAIDVDILAGLNYNVADKQITISTDFDLTQAGFEDITAHIMVNEQVYEVTEYGFGENEISTFILEQSVELKAGVVIKGWISLSYDNKTYASNASTIEFDWYFDANGDGKINLIDLVRLKKAIANIQGATIEKGACDFNGDNQLNASDLMVLRLTLLGSF